MTQQSAELKPLVPSQLDPPLNYHLITDVAGLEKVRDYLSRVSVFVIDTETNMTDNLFERRIRTIQLGDRNEQYIIDLHKFLPEGVSLASATGWYRYNDCFKPIVDVLRPALESKTHLKVGHNLQFDYEVLKLNLGLRMWNLYDTMWAEKVIYAGQVNFKISGFWALDDCVARYCNLLIDKSQQTTFDLENDLTDNQVVYCALDCRLPFSVKSGQYDKLTKGNLLYAAQIEFDAIPAFGDMKMNGIKLDVVKWKSLIDVVKQENVRNISKMDEFFIPVVGRKGIPDVDLVALEAVWKNTKDKEERVAARKEFMAARKALTLSKKNIGTYEGEAAINYGSNPQLLDALRKMGFTKTKLPDTNDTSLKKSAEHPKWDMAKVKEVNPDYSDVGVIDALRLYRETNKVLTTYGDDFIKKHVDPVTHRIHSSLVQLGAETGRTSSQKPNIQNIPRGSEWRNCFICEDGNNMITVDYNGCELRILAEYSKEKVFIDAFLNDWDVHSVGAEIVFGDEWKNAAEEGCAYYASHQKCKCKGHKRLRDFAKAINFGIAYGMEAKKLSEGVGCTEEEAEIILKKYRASFPTLIKYLEHSAKNATGRMESRTLAQRRRLFNKPSWQAAVIIATERLKKKGIIDVPNTRQISSAFKSMFSAIEREGKNTPIQGTNADIAKIAMGCGFDKKGEGFMWHNLEPKYNAKMVNFIHDEYVVESAKPVAEDTYKYIGDCMTRAGAELIKLIPMTYEGVISDRWKK